MPQHMDYRHRLIETLGFLKWLRLDDDGLEKARSCAGPGLKSVFLSPDVHSLHLVWVWEGGEIQHEIADYPDEWELEDNGGLRKWVLDEIGGDYWETFNGRSIEDALSDIADIPDAMKLPTVSLALLESLSPEED